MALRPGTRLGPYEIVAALGAGGMGEVYRARDTRLDREVAIKVLPESFAKDQDRLQRFEQESRSVAALNHPNIVAIYDVGRHNESPYLVTELLEGESLRSVLQQGALTERKAVDYAGQIIQGLASAHQKGIVHRDLKPENLFVTKDARIKILDFGLAKLAQVDAPGAAASTDGATLTGVVTAPGIAVGTPAYMSPEQLRGLPVDCRSDIFSFGLILHEMVWGSHPFQRNTSVETMNAILNAEPHDLNGTGKKLPVALQLIVSHCLEKDPQHRFQSALDVAFNLGAVSYSLPWVTVGAPKDVSRLSQWWPRLRVAAEVILASLLVTTFFLWQKSEIHPVQLRAAILATSGEGFWANHTQPAAISPDGKFLAIVSMRDGHTQLWLRRLDSSDAQPITGTEDAANPFWSPDSRYVGFFTDDRLKKVDVSGGTVIDLCPIGTYGFGGSWSSRGVIVFNSFGGTLRQVSDNGGNPQPIPGIALPTDALGQYWPVFLPDGKHFAYLEWRYVDLENSSNTVWIGSLDGEKPRRIPLVATNVLYSAGYLLFSRGGDLLAQKFDLERLELSGPAVPLARHIQYDTFFNNAAFTASANGILVYGAAGTGVNSELSWVDRDGKTLGVLGEPAQFEIQQISPDAQRVAVGIKDAAQAERIWVYDVAHGTRIPLTSTVLGSPYSPSWSPDGKQIAYRTTSGKSSAVKVRASDGSGDEMQIGRDFGDVLTVDDWSRDGRYLVIFFWQYRGDQGMHNSLQVWPVGSDPKPVLTIDNAYGGKLSHDGHWLSYSDANDNQLYVTPFPSRGGRIAISTTGGSEPRWRADGQELFYVANNRILVSVQVRESAQNFAVVSSHPLFRLTLPYNIGFYDVTRDGQRFLVNARTRLEEGAPLTVITDWPAQIRFELRNAVSKR
jgi:serine/threonine protein kinase